MHNDVQPIFLIDFHHVYDNIIWNYVCMNYNIKFAEHITYYPNPD